MDHTGFVRQEESPLFAKVLWNRPVSRNAAGRLLIIGGHSGDFSLVTGVYESSMAAGAGECTVVLPDILLKLLGGTPAAVFVPSSPSGSLGREALGRILELAEESDALCIGANLSNNSESAILVERLLQESNRPLIAFGEALVASQHHLPMLTERPDNLIIATMPEVFKLAGSLGVPISIRRDGGLVNKIEIVQSVRNAMQADLVVYGSEIIVAAGELPVITAVNYRLSLVPALYIGVLSVFWMQNAKDRRAGLSTGAYVLRNVSGIVGSTDRPSAMSLNRELVRQLASETT